MPVVHADCCFQPRRLATAVVRCRRALDDLSAAGFGAMRAVARFGAALQDIEAREERRRRRLRIRRARRLWARRPAKSWRRHIRRVKAGSVAWTTNNEQMRAKGWGEPCPWCTSKPKDDHIEGCPWVELEAEVKAIRAERKNQGG